MSSWDGKAINGADLQADLQAVAAEIKKRGLGEVVAESFVEIDGRLKALEDAGSNIGDVVADSVNTQVLKVKGVDASPSDHTHQVKINGSTKTVPKTGGTPIDLGTYVTPTGDGTNVTTTPTSESNYTKPTSATKLSVLFGKLFYFVSRLRTSVRAVSSASDTEFPSEKAVATAIDDKVKGVGDVGGMSSDSTHAYTGEAVCEKIVESVTGNVGGYIGEKTVAQMNAYTQPKMGDSAIVTDTGTITVGSVSCAISTAPSEVRWTTDGYWGVTSSGYVRDTKVATASALGLVKLNNSDGGVSLDSNQRMVVNGWSDKQNSLPTNTTPTDTYAINVSGSAKSVAPDEVRYNTDKNWLKVGTFVSEMSNTMYKGVTFSVEYRANDGNTQSGLLWISAGEYKDSGDYGNDDIVAEYSTIGRRTSTLSDDVKFYVKSLGTSSTSGFEIYAYLYNYSELSITPLNVPEGSYTPDMTYVNDEPSGKKEVTYSMLLRSPYGTTKGSTTNPVYVDDKGNVQPCDNANMSVGGANSAGYAATAGDSTFAAKVGSSSSHPQIGGPLVPVYVTADGLIVACNNPSGWTVGAASYADVARYLATSNYGGCDTPSFIKATSQNYLAELGTAFDIPHTISRWHEELNYPSFTGFGIIHKTELFKNGTSKPLSMSVNISSDNSLFRLTLDASSQTPWHGGQVWGTAKWDSQSGSNINSSVERIGNGNLSDSETVLASRRISVSNIQDIQGHVLFAICTGGESQKNFVVDMEISIIKPNAANSISYVTVCSKCSSESSLI